MVSVSRSVRRLSSLHKLRVRGKNNRVTPLLGKPSPKRFLSIRNEEVLQRGHERALRAGERMQQRAVSAFKKKVITQNEYFRLRQAIEEKQHSLLGKIKSQSKRLSERDPKFGMLYTPKKSKELAEQLLKMKGPASLVLVDVDHFKRINDSFGHDVGDVALRLIATVANRAARKMSGFAGRFGGEEFLIGLPGGKRNGIRFIKLLNRELEIEFSRSETVRSALRGELFTFSSGIVEKGEKTGFDDLFKLADKRLYTAKHHGRNRVVFSSKSSTVIRRK